MGDKGKSAASPAPGTSARRVSVLRCLLVLVILAPLTFAAGWSYTPPGWSFERPLGVPLTVIASTAVLLVLVLLTARYGVRRVARNDEP